MLVLDSHIHLFAETGAPESPVGEDDAARYGALRRAHGIERALVIGFEGESRFAGNNAHILELATTHRWAVPVAFLPCAQPPTQTEIRSWRTRGAAGFALYASTAREAEAIAHWPSSVFEAISAQRCIVSLNAPPEAISMLADALGRLVDCRVLISHLGLPGRYDSTPTHRQATARLAPLLTLAKSECAFVKLSGLYAICDSEGDGRHAIAQPFVDVVLEAFGPRRVLWGSDFPPVLAHMSFAHTLNSASAGGCTPTEVAQIMEGNLSHILESPGRR